MFVYREAYYLERKQPKLGSIEHVEWQSKMNDVNGLADINNFFKTPFPNFWIS